ncbi:MAG: mycoredoxin [Pseudonocardiaceae bacterium]
MIELTMYTTVWCGYCRRLKAQLARAGIGFREVDIEHDAAAAAFVADVNGGNQTVPTVQLPDGSVLINPTIDQLIEGTAA